MSKIVLDASAVLALLHREQGWRRVAEELPDAVISTVNLSEVVAKLAERGINEADIQTILDGLAITPVAFDQQDAVLAGLLRPKTRDLGLSLGDRACLAVAAARQLPVLTADRCWAEARLDLEVRLVRDR